MFTAKLSFFRQFRIFGLVLLIVAGLPQPKATASDTLLHQSSMQALSQCMNSLKQTSLAFAYCKSMALGTSLDAECSRLGPIELVNQYINQLNHHPDSPVEELAQDIYQRFAINNQHCSNIDATIHFTHSTILKSTDQAHVAYENMITALFSGAVPTNKSLLVPTHSSHLEFQATDTIFQPDSVSVWTSREFGSIAQESIFSTTQSQAITSIDTCTLSALEENGQRWCTSQETFEGSLVVHPRFKNGKLKLTWQIMIEESLLHTTGFVLFISQSQQQSSVIKNFMSREENKDFTLVQEHSQAGLSLFLPGHALYSHGLLYSRNLTP